MQQVKRARSVGKVASSNSLLALVQDVWLSRLVLVCAITLQASLPAAEGQTTILSSVPANGATGVSGESPVVFTFSTNMNTTATFAYFFAGTSLVFVSPSWSADGTHMTNTPPTSFPGGTTINWMVMGQSAAGAMLGGTTTGSFTTGSGGPTIVSVTPTNGSSNVSLSAPVVFTFSTNMDQSATRVVLYNTFGSPVPMTAAWNSEGTRLTNTPSPALSASTYFTWLGTGQDAFGRALTGGLNGSFMTGTGGTSIPTLVSTTPTNGATGVLTNAPVYFAFSVAMNANLTSAQFHESTAPGQALPVTLSWAANGTVLSCTPNPAFPAGKAIMWSVQGQAVTGDAFAGATGSFTTVVSPGPLVLSALLSRGELFEQVDTNLLQTSGQEFRALAGKAEARTLAFVKPSLVTNVLSSSGTVQATEFTDSDNDPLAFATNYPIGDYQFLIHNAVGSDANAVIALSDGLLPSPARLLNWRTPPHAVLGQPLTLQWSLEAGGAAVNYVRLRIKQNGRAVFASPLPDSAGALNATSNNVVVPADLFTNAGVAEVSISAFSYTGLETNSIPGLTLHAARHRTTTFALRVVDGATPPPTLVTTNITALPMEEPLLIPLRSTNGVRPIRYRVLSGALPPGATLEPTGILTGVATAEGLYESTVELTDLLGRSVTQALRLGTVPLPAGSIRPKLENAAMASQDFVVDLVDPTPLNTVLEHSPDLAQWTAFYTNVAAVKRATVRLPVSGNARFVRARTTANYPPQPGVNPLTVFPVTNTNITASASFNEWGGTLRLTNGSGSVFTLSIPPGALSRTETITMTEITQVGGLPLRGGLIAAVDLQPEGLRFDDLVRLDITPSSSVQLRTLVGFNAQAAGTRFGLQPSFLTNNTISLYLRHFSMAGAGNGETGDTSAQTQRPPGEGAGRSDQEVADEMARCQMDPSCDINSQEEQAKLRDIFVRQADQVVIPKLREAMGSDSAVEQAILGWLDWVRQLSLSVYNGDAFNAQGNGALESRLRLTQTLAGQVLKEAIRFNCQLCMSSDVRRIARVITFSRWAALLGFDPGNEPFSCMQKCLKFKLEIDSQIDSVDENKKKVKTTTRAEVEVQPLNLDGSSEILTLEGSGEWKIEEMEFPSLPKECKSTTASTTGTADVKLLRISLYRQKTVSTDEGELVTYEFAPQVHLSIKANLDDMPKEGRTIKCGDLVNQEVADIFGPTFFAFHNDEVEIPEAGSLAQQMLGGPVFTITDFFDPGAGGVFMFKQYIREQPLNDGGNVTELTVIQVLHNP